MSTQSQKFTTSTITDQREPLPDVLKGFAILLVVLGHAIQSNLPSSFDDNIVFRIIYSFHMPLFMFISGYVSYKTFDGSFGKLSKRFRSLIIPFWIWFFISYLFFMLLHLLNGGGRPDLLYSFFSVLKSPDSGGLWFLWILFLNYLVLFCALKISKRKEEWIVLLILVALNIFLRLSNFNYLGLEPLSWHLGFFLTGYAIHKHKLALAGALRIAGIASVILFPVLVSYWSRSGLPVFPEMFKAEGWQALIIRLIFKVLVPITGILATATVFNWLLSRGISFRRTLAAMGMLTLEIYAIHFYFIQFSYLDPSYSAAIRIAISFVIALSGSLLLQFVLKKSSLWSGLLFGKGVRS